MKPFIQYLEEAEREIEDEGRFKAPEPAWFPTTQKPMKKQKEHEGSGDDRSITNKNKNVDNPNGKIENLPHVKKIKK